MEQVNGERSETVTIRSEEERLRVELERAYRAVRGLIAHVARGTLPDKAVLGYHALTIAAAIRFVETGDLGGSDYFVGKDVAELQSWLGKARGRDR